MSDNKKIRELIHKVALRHNKPDYLVKTVYENVFKAIRENIQEVESTENFEDFPVIRLKILGTLYPDKRIHKSIEAKKDGNKDKI